MTNDLPIADDEEGGRTRTSRIEWRGERRRATREAHHHRCANCRDGVVAREYPPRSEKSAIRRQPRAPQACPDMRVRIRPSRRSPSASTIHPAASVAFIEVSGKAWSTSVETRPSLPPTDTHVELVSVR